MKIQLKPKPRDINKGVLHVLPFQQSNGNLPFFFLQLFYIASPSLGFLV
jgi:hypothetical protein